MTGSEIDRRFALACEASEAAAAMALRHWHRRGQLTVDTKANPQDFVSEADRAVERAIRATVGAAFPKDGFLGEEFGASPGASGFTWVIDPIDGTSPFLHGIPNWCVAVAVLRDRQTVIGVTVAPTHGEIFAARLGRGATLNGAALVIPPDVTVRNTATGFGASPKNDRARMGARVAALMQRGGMVFCNGSGALMLAYVAAGRLAGYLTEHMNAWDCLGGLLLVREAGGIASEFRQGGDLSQPDQGLAAAPKAWDDLAQVLGT